MSAGDLSLMILISAQNQASSVIRSIASDLGPVGMGMAAIGIGAAGAGIAAIKMAGDFQSATTTLVTGAGESAANIDMVRKGILGISVDTGTTTKQLVDGMFMIESAGYHGAAGLNVLKVAAEGAKVGNADLGTVANAVTTVMKDYGISAGNASTAMNFLTAIVQNGKTTMQDLSASMSQVLPTASAVGVHLVDVGAAMATMTGEGVNASQAATYLRQMLITLSGVSTAATLKKIGLTSQEVSTELKTSLPGALQLIMTHLAETYKVGSPEYVAALTKIAGGSKQMQGMLDLTGQHLKDFQQNMKNVSGVMNQNKGAVAGWSEVQKDFNFKVDQAKAAFNALMITLGTYLLPVVSKIVGAIGPAIGAFTKWISSGDNLHNTLEILKPLLAAIAIVILATVVPALWSMAAGMIAATWPVLLIIAALAGAIAIFKHWYDTNAGFKSFIDNIVTGFKNLWSMIQANFIPALQLVWNFIQTKVLPMLQQVGQFLLSTFKPVWDQLVQTWQQQLLPTLKQLWSAIQPLMPIFAGLGLIIVGIVVIAFGILVGVLKGTVQAIAGFLSGLAIMIGGVVKVFTGVIQVISGIVTFIVDLLTGNFSALGGDLGRIWSGIVNIFSGAWDIISGIFRAAWGVISGYVSGLVSGIIGFFQNLFNSLVGHSIIPDMVNAIVNWFKNLWDRVVAFVLALVHAVINHFNEWKTQAINAIQGMVSWITGTIRVWATFLILRILWLKDQAINHFNELKSQAINAIQGMVNTITSTIGGLISNAFTWGKNLIGQLASGILSNIGSAIGGAMSAVGGFISSHLPSSPAKMGPLKDLAKQGAHISEQIGIGIISGVPHIERAMVALVKPISANANGSFSLSTAHSQSFALSGNQPIVVQVQPVAASITMDGKKVGESTMRYAAREVRIQGQYRNQ